MIVLKEAVPVEDGGRVADGRKLNMDASTIFLSVVVSKRHISTWAHLNLGHYNLVTYIAQNHYCNSIIGGSKFGSLVQYRIAIRLLYMPASDIGGF